MKSMGELYMLGTRATGLDDYHGYTKLYREGARFLPRGKKCINAYASTTAIVIKNHRISIRIPVIPKSLKINK